MDFWNMIYENAEKKHSFHNNIYIYIYIGSQTFQGFMNFYFVHIA